MKTLKSEDGFALISALMITSIILVICLGILTVVASNIRSIGMKKVYQSALEASYGGAELQTSQFIPRLMGDIIDSDVINQSGQDINRFFSGYADATGQIITSGNRCMFTKLTMNTADWTTGGTCDGDILDLTSSNLRVSTDFTLNLPGALTPDGIRGPSYTVLSKIADTSIGVPYIPQPRSGPMNSSGAAASGGLGIASLVSHYVYRLEVSASRANNTDARGVVSVLYEY